MADSTIYVRKSKRFPLYRHTNGSWCKRIAGKLHYFGKDKAEALAAYQEFVRTGRKSSSRKVVGQCRIADLLTAFLESKLARVQAGDLALGTYRGYQRTAALIREVFGDTLHVESLQSADMATLYKALTAEKENRSGDKSRRRAKTVDNLVTQIRVIFKFAYDEELIDRPVRFSKSLPKPSKKTLRLERAERGDMSFTPAELRQVLDLCLADRYPDGGSRNPDPQLHAMILIAIQSGMGNADLGSLEFSDVDLTNGWIDLLRLKTGNPRRFPLWPETIQAIRKAIEVRPEPADKTDANIVFITRRDRRRWHVDGKLNSVGLQFRRLLERLGLYRERRTFYSLRRTFETVACELDQVATDHIMGHIPPADDMSARYRQKISDERLQKVVDHVRQWLFSGTKKLKRDR
jgi:integrase